MIPAIFLVLFLVWGIFLAWWWIPARWNRAPVKKAPSKKRYFTQIAAVPVAIVLAATLLIDPNFVTIRVLPETLPVVIAGFFVFLAGLSFAVRARLHLGTNWSGRPAIRDNHTLTRTGPYAIVRHPIYTGLLTGILGTAIVTGSLLAFFCLVGIFVMFFIKIRIEEGILLEEFGAEYEEYRHRTKALVPWIV